MPRVNAKDKRKQQLMEANIASIARRGLADTTIAHISKGADMSRGIVNFYFTSKEKMMLETLAFLADEYTTAWQTALAERRKSTSDPLALIESILCVLTHDKLCSAKRLAVWSAFIGHAGTHTAYAKILRSMDEALAKQLRGLWQKAVSNPALADQRARQMLALLRGHYLMSALGDSKRPSFYQDAWKDWMEAMAKGSMAKPRLVAAKSKKSGTPDILPGQLDFGDLFSR